MAYPCTLKGETSFESGPGLRIWIVPESADGCGTDVAARVGASRGGSGSRVSVGSAWGVGLLSGKVGEAFCRVGELAVSSGNADTDGVGVSGTLVRVGADVTVAGTQAVRRTNAPQSRRKRRNMSGL